MGIIGTAALDILRSALAEAERERCAGLLIVLDTPGGALDATREIVKLIMAAPIPVVVWVGPDGSRAGSAGAFITIAAHVSAMAPGTNIGASTPIQASGEDISNKNAARKIENDTAAFMESIAKARNKNSELAASFVVTGASITATVALENNIIDLISPDTYDLMTKINGREVSLQEGEKSTIKSANVTFSTYKRSVRQQVLEILSNPNLFYLLFTAGMIGLGFELTHPGSIFPGVAGGICMILALVATAVLPINFGAMLLILTGVAFLVGEMFIPSFGVLGIGGLIAFVMGSLLLIDPSNELGLRISWLAIAPGAAMISAASLGIGYLVFRSETAPAKSGVEGMIGKEAVALTDFVNFQGRVRCMGEDWQAELLSENVIVTKGCVLIVTRVSGLKLFVRSIENT